MYDEAADFRAHKREIDDMVAAIGDHVDLRGTVTLNVGAGQGMHAGFLQALGCERIWETDVADYDLLYDRDFRRRLWEKHERHGQELDLGRVKFLTTPAESLLFRDAFFDFALAINAFEHVADPRRVLAELIRCLRPGGCAYISFDPIYCCDTGSHMFPFTRVPWGHLVLPEAEFIALMREHGASDADVHDFRFGVNRLRAGEFRALFDEAARSLGVEILVRTEWQGVEDESHRQHPSLAALRQRYSEDDLFTRRMRLLLRRRPAGAPRRRWWERR